MGLAAKFKELKRLTGIFLKAFPQHPLLALSLLVKLPIARFGLSYARKCPVSRAENPLSAAAGALCPPNTLKAYFDAHTQGRGIWKWDHYFDIYQRNFAKFVGKEVHVLEIGVYSGGSIQMWRDYFGPKCRVYGVDVEKCCKAYENDHTDIFIGDQVDRGFWKKFKQTVPRIDILIDDGGHQIVQQIVTLEEMLPHIAPGGVYLCEDIYGKGNEFTSFAHGLADSLNNYKVASARPGFTSITTSPFQGMVKSISFYPYAVVIEKTETPQTGFVASKHGTEWQPFLGK